MGIDIGTSSIKIVELKLVENRPVLSNYAWMPVSEEFLGKSDVDPDAHYAALGACIRRMLKKASISSKNAYISIPASSGLITMIDLPEMSEADIDKAIKFEAHKYIATPLDNLVVSWEVVDRKPVKKAVTEEVVGAEKIASGGKELEVLLVIGLRDRILKYEKMIEDAELGLRSIDLETFPLSRVCVGNDDGTFILTDIGSHTCNIVLVEKKIIRISRSIDTGGKEITETIAKSMNIDFERAETLKMSERNFFGEDSSISFFALDMISGEINRVVESYRKKYGAEKNIDGLILSGGVSNMAGIDEYFQRKVQLETLVGNPFRRLSHDQRLDGALSKINNRFAVAVGLALKGVDEYLAKSG